MCTQKYTPKPTLKHSYKYPHKHTCKCLCKKSSMGGVSQNLEIFPLWPASMNVNWHQRLAADVLRALSDTPDALGKLCVACAAKDSSAGLSSSLYWARLISNMISNTLMLWCKALCSAINIITVHCFFFFSFLFFFFKQFVYLVFPDWTLYSVINIYGWIFPSVIKFKCVLPKRLCRGPLGNRSRYTLDRRCQHKSHVVSPLNKTHAWGHFSFVLWFFCFCFRPTT